MENNNNIGVFQWIRELVRRAVLLGFSDAVEQIGVPTDSHELHPKLASVLRDSASTLTSQPAANQLAGPSRPAARGDRKRLGRSLDQIRDTTSKPNS